MLECVVNVSQGRGRTTIDALAESCGRSLLDVHSDFDYDRSVFTLAGERVFEDVQRLAQRVLELVDFRSYGGIHPALGALDVVPFVPLGDTPLEAAVEMRDRFAKWLSVAFDLPVFVYGEGATLPQLRKGAFTSMPPTFGSPPWNPVLGAVCVGARGLLIALNVNLACSLERAQVVARTLRSTQVRALAFIAGDRVQVSMNLIDPLEVTPLMVVKRALEMEMIRSVELVGLLPEAVVVGRESEYEALGMSSGATIERCLRRQLAHS
jgi:glutamate formiminotransferase